MRGGYAMRCIVCNKKTDGKTDICVDCDKLMDLLYKKHPEDKEIAIKTFRIAMEDYDEGD
jgi:hypothetical protein